MGQCRGLKVVDHMTILSMLMRVAKIICWRQSIVIEVMTDIQSAICQRQLCFLFVFV